MTQEKERKFSNEQSNFQFNHGNVSSFFFQILERKMSTIENFKYYFKMRMI